MKNTIIIKLNFQRTNISQISHAEHFVEINFRDTYTVHVIPYTRMGKLYASLIFEVLDESTEDTKIMHLKIWQHTA